MSAAGNPGEVLARVEGELRAMWAGQGAPGQTPSARACTMKNQYIPARTARTIVLLHAFSV